MPSTPNIAIPYPASSDNPMAATLAAMCNVVDLLAGAWTDYTVTIVQSSTVSSTKLYGKYRVVSKTCEFNFAVDLNANGTGGSPVTITLPPVTPKYTTTDMPRGLVDFVSQGTQGQLVSPSGNTTTVRIDVFAGQYTTALSSTDFLRGYGKYEVA